MLPTTDGGDAVSRPLDIFRSLSVALDEGDLIILRRDVRAHFEELERLRARSELASVDLAEELCSRLEVMLDAYERFDAVGRAAVVGAARYFVAAHDAVPDELDGGLDDDVEVFNRAARIVGRSEIAIRR